MKHLCRFVCCSLILFFSTHCYAIDFFLVDASIDSTIGQLQSGDAINLQQVGSDLNIRAEVTENMAQEAVRFELDGEVFRTERGAPYALAGDDGNGDYYAWTPDTGTHTLIAFALDSSSNILAQSTITFSVSNTSVGSQFDKSRGDLICLHYDHRADPDDGHSAAADLTLIDYYGLGSNVHVVSGTYGYNSEEPYENSEDYHEFYQEESEDVMIAAWGTDWLNAHNFINDDLNTAVPDTASVWAGRLGADAHIWIKEGGPSDFTAEVLKTLYTDYSISVATTRARVHLVQHGPTNGSVGFNERHTIPDNLKYVKENTDYIMIEGGNDINDTAGLVIMRDDPNGILDIEDFMDRAKAHTTCGGAWSAAFNYYNPLDNNAGAEDYWPWDSRLDFSDTVELLYILNVDTGTVADCNDFADAYLPSACPAFVPGPDACTSDCPCGEGEGDCDSDADCEAGLTCVQDVGADYGWPASRDVCEAACPAFVPGPDACTISCPCGEGEGDCDSDAECEAGLTCVQGVGADYGWPAGRDVCQ